MGTPSFSLRGSLSYEVLFRRYRFLAGAFLAGAFLAGAFTGALFAGAFLAGAFFAGAFAAGAFLAGAFAAGAFFAGAFLFRAALRTELGVNFIAVEAAILTGAPVWGFRPTRALRLVVEKDPKPGQATLPPFFASDCTTPKKADTTSSATPFVTPA